MKSPWLCKDEQKSHFASVSLSKVLLNVVLTFAIEIEFEKIVAVEKVQTLFAYLL